MLKFAQMSKVYTLWSARVVPSTAVDISCTSIRAYAWRTVIFRPGYKHFLMSNFADGKNIQFTIRILSRPTLWITVTETVVKAQRSLRWEMEFESGSHRVKPSSFQHVALRQNRLLSLLSYLWHYNRYFAFTRDNITHPTPNRREDVWRQKLVAAMKAMAAVSVMRMRIGSSAHIIASVSRNLTSGFWVLLESYVDIPYIDHIARGCWTHVKAYNWVDCWPWGVPGFSDN